MTQARSTKSRSEQRSKIAKTLRRMEIIEGLLEFDLVSMQLYSDSIAGERQLLSMLLIGSDLKR